MPAAQKIVLYIDVVSPWTFVAFTVLQRYKKQWDLDLKVIPINLGYVMKFSGNRPPVTIENKWVWMNEDMERASKFYGVTLNRPAKFPINTSSALSVLRLISLESPSDLEVAVQAFFEAIWHHNKSVDTPEAIQGILEEQRLLLKGSELTSLIQRGVGKEEKNKLTKESEELVKQGCFGMPWMIITRANGETSRWFGSDRFDQMASWLGKEYKGPFADGRIAKL